MIQFQQAWSAFLNFPCAINASAQHTQQVALVFLESKEIVIIRIKDRFVEKPSPGGWRDLMINFYMANDPKRHICEVQVNI